MIYYLLHETNKEVIQRHYIGGKSSYIFSEKFFQSFYEKIVTCTVWDHWIKQCPNLNLISIYEIKSINWYKYAHQRS